MNRRSIVSRGWRIAALMMMTAAWADAFGQDNIQFVSPDNNARLPLNVDKAVTIRYRIGNVPERGDVTLTTTLGSVAVPTIRTDDFGIATFIINSSDEGTAELTATSVIDSNTRLLRFEAPGSGDPLDLEPVHLPFGEFSVLREDENGRKFWLAKNRIAVRPEDTLRVSDIDGSIGSAGIVDRFYISDNLYVLVLDDDVRTQPLRELMRVLQDYERPGTSFKPFRKAGLVAQRDQSDQAYMVPDEIIVRFVAEPSQADQIQFKMDFGLAELNQLGRNPNRFLAEIDDMQVRDPIQLATDMTRDPRVANADPNFAAVMKARSAAAGEPGFHFQWYHRNDGSYGTEDADIDTDLAWHFTEGSSSVIIAVADTGFDIDHPDLVENLDPANLLVDLVDQDPTDLLSDNLSFDGFAHGTNAAGVAGARGDNNRGYAGSCPQCRLLLIRHEYSDNFDKEIEAIETAADKMAHVLSISWGFEAGDEADEFRLAIEEVVDSGTTIVMAMTNEDIDNCVSDHPDSSSIEKVIAVSGITDQDLRSPYYGEAKGHGNCMDVLAPTRGGVKGVHTTSVQMIGGEAQSTYWYNFSGTSAATPLVAGVIGLMKTLDPMLTPLEVQRILQDTADRVDPANANYSAEFGFSNPDGIATHGNGRINAYEAVKLVAPVDPGDVDIPAGRASMDLLLRDNPTDWGNTERPSNTIFNAPRGTYSSYQSVDIKIDSGADGDLVNTPAGFASMSSEAPLPGVAARVYVRLRNRGPDPVANTRVKLHTAVIDNTFPSLPDDFWELFPGDATDTTIWQPITPSPPLTVPYSGASVAACPGRNGRVCFPTGVTDNAIIVMFDLPGRNWDADSGESLALLVAAHSPDDPPKGQLTGNSAYNNVEAAVNFDNNVTLWESRNVGGGSVSTLWLAILTMTIAVSRWRRRR